MNQKYILTLFLCNFLFGCSVYDNPQITPLPPINPILNISIPTAGNSWVLKNGKYTSSDLITPVGIRNWRNQKHSIRIFFYMETAGEIFFGIKAKVELGISKLKVNFGKKSQNITLKENDFEETYIGDFQADSPGYYFIELTGLEKDGAVYADIDAILLGGNDGAKIKFIKDDFYFGRRGPSVHLNFNLPVGVEDIEWFYSELIVPQNQDVIGSYFMANGFGEGYFGIQVNSENERRILFSIWSPYKTDNPSEIPAAYKIKLLKKGAGVTTGEFGNEGSGGQSYKVYDWKAGVNYRFLVGAKPTSDGNTDYSAYFQDPADQEWKLIAKFRRPKTTTYLTRLYSFLENFIPDTGVLERKALYGNQWAYNSSGWHELKEIIFTADNTARKEYRLDYSGGIENNQFYLKNCGFTNDNVLIDTRFERIAGGVAPAIDFLSLD